MFCIHRLWRHFEVIVEATKIKCYTELIRLSTFEQRFEYLKVPGTIGEITFGGHRYLNQKFYRGSFWKRIRRNVIIRDLACDMGLAGYDIIDDSDITIHHMNPITIEDIVNLSKYAVDPEYLICVRNSTHKAIHYGSIDYLSMSFAERKPNDTCPWKY